MQSEAISGRTIKIGVAVLLLVVLLYNCHGSPPVPLPWQSSEAYTVETVSSDYDVSRFWGCGWAGGCPMKQWTRCLKITPKEPVAALLWQARTSKADREIATQLMDESAPVNWSVNAPGRLERQIAYATQNGRTHDWETRLLQDIRAVQRNDRATIDGALAKTREGLLFTATYQIMGENTPTGWSLYPGC